MAGIYFALAFAITWALQLPALLAKYEIIAGPQEKWLGLVGLGAFGPMFAAMIASKLDGTGIKALFRPLGTWRVGAMWYAIALLAPGGLFAIVAALWNLFGHAEPLLYPPNAPAYALAAIVFPFGEEIGWRGFALPRLQSRIGPLGASAVIGVLWMLWHIPMLALQGVGPLLYVVFLPYMIGGSIFFTWIYRHTRGSLLLAVLTHVGVHLSNPGRAMPDRVTPMVLAMIGWVLVALGIVVFDHGIWRARA